MEKKEKLLTEFELAVFLALAVSTVRRNRSTAPHRLPPWVKIGSSVRWRMATVQEWLTAHEVGGGIAAPTPSTKPQKQAHLGTPTKAERIKKAKSATK